MLSHQEGLSVSSRHLLKKSCYSEQALEYRITCDTEKMYTETTEKVQEKRRGVPEGLPKTQVTCSWSVIICCVSVFHQLDHRVPMKHLKWAHQTGFIKIITVVISLSTHISTLKG
ncbi:uncharacterized protein LOC110440623 [Mizuhopecten yessoensis]|uniref:uncharacterized protein LOC110440623 n=1 Tax=Mizuhopecten yessoensis TaxID=6573 RepID=UPI000B45F856|nr:uncharacterized protein LOC110440623 [Mizuhopecten yessoensis]